MHENQNMYMYLIHCSQRFDWMSKAPKGCCQRIKGRPLRRSLINTVEHGTLFFRGRVEEGVTGKMCAFADTTSLIFGRQCIKNHRVNNHLDNNIQPENCLYHSAYNIYLHLLQDLFTVCNEHDHLFFCIVIRHVKSFFNSFLNFRSMAAYINGFRRLFTKNE